MDLKDFLAVARQRAAIAAGGEDDAIVETPFEVVDDRLDVIAAKAAQHNLVHVGPTVAVGVLEIVQVRRRQHKQSAAIATDRRRPRQLVGEDHAAIGLAVAVGIFQQPDDARVFLPAARWIELGRLPGKGVIAHLGHIQAAVLVEAGVDRAGDLRLRGEQLEAKSMLELKSPAGLVRRHGRNPRQLVGQGLRGHFSSRAGDGASRGGDDARGADAEKCPMRSVRAGGVRTSLKRSTFRGGRSNWRGCGCGCRVVDTNARSQSQGGPCSNA